MAHDLMRGDLLLYAHAARVASSLSWGRATVPKQTGTETRAGTETRPRATSTRAVRRQVLELKRLSPIWTSMAHDLLRGDLLPGDLSSLYVPGLFDAAFTTQEIAKAVGLSQRRVQQIVAEGGLRPVAKPTGAAQYPRAGGR